LLEACYCFINQSRTATSASACFFFLSIFPFFAYLFLCCAATLPLPPAPLFPHHFPIMLSSVASATCALVSRGAATSLRRASSLALQRHASTKSSSMLLHSTQHTHTRAVLLVAALLVTTITPYHHHHHLLCSVAFQVFSTTHFGTRADATHVVASVVAAVLRCFLFFLY
jgi:hypothetical protein